jgi:inhibitor of cysteine peptidase
MRIKGLLACIFIGLLLAATGCKKSVAVIKLDAESNGGSVEMAVGDQLQVVLEGNPTTGYVWDLYEVDRDVLDMPEMAGYQQEGEDLGAGGMFTLTFVAVKAGQTQLSLRYFRPFELEAPPEDTFVLDVTVK